MQGRLGTLASCAAIVGLAAACGPLSSITIGGGRPPSRIEPARPPGPPPHAPAHGYRYKQRRSGGDDVELVFDSGLGVYVVVGIPSTYYWDGYYLRLDGERWYASVDLDGGWEPRTASRLPPGLQKKQEAARGHPGKGRGRGKSAPAKGRW